METVLIVSGSEKGAVFFEALLRELSFRDITVLKGAGEARRLAVQRDFDLCIINAPLPDEFGDTLAVDLARKTLTQVILVVKAELYGEISARVETVGVLTCQTAAEGTVLDGFEAGNSRPQQNGCFAR